MPSTAQLDLTRGELAFVDGQFHCACIQAVIGVTVIGQNARQARSSVKRSTVR